jgi:hypothetical protein
MIIGKTGTKASKVITTATVTDDEEEKTSGKKGSKDTKTTSTWGFGIDSAVKYADST